MKVWMKSFSPTSWRTAGSPPPPGAWLWHTWRGNGTSKTRPRAPLHADQQPKSSASPHMSVLQRDCILTWFDFSHAQWMSHGVCSRCWVSCVTPSPRARRPLIIKTAGFDVFPGFSSTSRSPRGEELSCSSITRRRRRWNAAAPVASPETVSTRSCSRLLFCSCFPVHHEYPLFQFPVIWPYFTTRRLKTTWTASTCTVQHWRAAFSATEATLFCTMWQKVRQVGEGETDGFHSALYFTFLVCFLWLCTVYICWISLPLCK